MDWLIGGMVWTSRPNTGPLYRAALMNRFGIVSVDLDEKVNRRFDQISVEERDGLRVGTVRSRKR